MSNIFDQYADEPPTDEYDPCAHCGGHHLNQDCKTPRQGYYIDPETGDTYEASVYGYYEQIHSTNYGDVRGVKDSTAIKFADAPNFIPKDQYLATGEDYIDLHEMTVSYGFDLAWLMNKLQDKGVNLREGPPGVFAPDEIPMSVHQEIMKELLASPPQEQTISPPAFDSKAFALGLKNELDRAIAAGLSQTVVRTHTQVLIADNGKTQRCLDLIAERLDGLIAGQKAMKLHKESVIDAEYVLNAAPMPDVDAIAERMQLAEVNEDGEVLNLQDVYEALGLDDKRVLEKLGLVQAEQFVIKDRPSSNWFVSRIRAMQHRCDDIAEMAALGINEQLRFMQGMMFRYGGELKEYNASVLPLKKDGSYRQKNVKYDEGAVHFKKGGGWKITDYAALQEWADGMKGYQHKYREALEKILEVSEGGIEKIAQEALDWKSPLDDFPITISRKVDKRKIVKLAQNGAKIPGVTESEVRELSVMAIGGQRAWSIKKLKESLELKTDKYKLLTVGEDESEGADNENDVTDIDTD